MWTQDDFIGGHLALDFINTVADTGKSRIETRIKSKNALDQWWQAAVHNVPGNWPSQLANINTDEIHDLRETAYEVVSGFVGNEGPSAKHVDQLRGYTDGAIARADMVWTNKTLVRTAAKENATDVFSLLIDDFLFGPLTGRVTQCGRCTWLYVNLGRGRGRKWCNMRTCGNRAKVERYRNK